MATKPFYQTLRGRARSHKNILPTSFLNPLSKPRPLPVEAALAANSIARPLHAQPPTPTAPVVNCPVATSQPVSANTPMEPLPGALNPDV